MRRTIGWLLLAALASGCAGASVAQPSDALMARDREWSTTVKDSDKFLSFFAADASIYAFGMPKVTGTNALRDAWKMMSSAPGFALEFTPDKAIVTGDLGYTTGTYKSSMAGVNETGKYLTVWRKQADGSWKVAEDSFNADADPNAVGVHSMTTADALQWGDAPPSLPPGAKVAGIAGNPAQPGPFIVRLQLPAGYKIAPHWHPAVEQVTVLSGTVAIGMGDKWDDAGLKTMATGGFVSLPAEMRHYLSSKSASTIQVQGFGPLVLNYVNPADDPSKKK